VPNFVSFAASIAELTHGEKSQSLSQSINHPACVLNHSFDHSPSLFDAPGTKACTSEYLEMLLLICHMHVY